jgi:P-type conjugative transfer protein TrbG
MSLSILLIAIAIAAAEASAAEIPWSEGAVYTVTATPGRVTDIVLEPGEELAGTGPVAAGDTARWIIGDSESGSGAQRRRHVLVKPTAPDIATNLVVNTDRRTYHIELRATPGTYMASVAWRYPAAELIAVKGVAAKPGFAAAPPPPAPDLERLNFAWRLEGRASWKPERVYDDGERVVIEFPTNVQQLPPLFERGEDGKLQLLNYRVVGRRLIVDRLFSDGELRLGGGKRPTRVRLVRNPAP